MVFKLDPDIIGITESWCTPAIANSELQLSGYDVFRCDRQTDNKGGGVLLYVKSVLKPLELQLSSPFQDHIWCKVGNLVIGVCYRSSNRNIVGSDNDSYLCQLLRDVSKKHFLLMGDFNYPNIDWHHCTITDLASSDCKSFVESFNDCFLTQHVSKPTRGNSVLDLVISREPDLVSGLEVIENLGKSDHNMVTFTAHLSHDDPSSSRQFRDYCKGDYQSIRDHLHTIDWDVFMSGDTLHSWKKFKDLMLELEQRHIPLKKPRKRKQKVKPIWMTNKALKCIERKGKVYRKYKDKVHPAVKAANKAVTREIKKAKQNFEKKLALNIKHDSKSFFAYVRSKSKSKVRAGSLIDDNDKLLTCDNDIADHFNQYFSSVFTSEDTSGETTFISDQLPPDHVSCTDLQFSESTVLSGLSKLRSDKSMGPDGMAPRLLIEIKDLISYPLYILFRKSLDESVVPEDWKEAIVTPIFKQGSRNRAENYRPVSLTSLVCKLFEGIVRDALTYHLESNCLVKDSQHGFRKGRSCLTNLLQFLDKVTSSVDAGHCVDIVFLDLAKAFDKVPHDRLLFKLRNHGIDGKILNWIEQWLKGRAQRVGIRGELSKWLEVLSGVPQGSVLGPLLFLVYINDLDVGISNWILKFADDTKIFSQIRDDKDRERLQEDLQKLCQWSEEWKMLFNVSKCKVMHVGRQQEQNSYFMNKQQLKCVDMEKDLGVIISNDLKVSRQCQMACSKASKMLGLINRTIEFKHRDVLIRLYKSLVRPHLEFCTPAWSPHYRKDRDLIEKIQRRFTRMIPNISKLPYDQRLTEVGLWSLEDRRLRADLIEVYKIIHGLSSVSFQSFFEFCHHDRTRGHNLKLHKHSVRTDLRQHFFTERIINVWNKLDEDTVSASSLNSFKRRLQKMYSDESFPRLI